MRLIHQALIYLGIVTGFILLIVGIALLVLPGPGWISILLGLTLLACHFLWAQRLLREVRNQIREGEEWVKREVVGIPNKKK
ncbi:MAG: PGPGW domain-containing protein [Nanoarchaeota archaeon]